MLAVWELARDATIRLCLGVPALLLQAGCNVHRRIPVVGDVEFGSAPVHAATSHATAVNASARRMMISHWIQFVSLGRRLRRRSVMVVRRCGNSTLFSGRDVRLCV